MSKENPSGCRRRPLKLSVCIASGYCRYCWAFIEAEAYSEHCQTFKTESFAKRRIPGVAVLYTSSTSLNMPKYLWKYLNKLFWLYQGSEYAWSSYMFERRLKMPCNLNMPGFWIWQGLHRVLNMFEYGSICLYVRQYVWTWRNIVQCP